MGATKKASISIASLKLLASGHAAARKYLSKPENYLYLSELASEMYENPKASIKAAAEAIAIRSFPKANPKTISAIVHRGVEYVSTALEKTPPPGVTPAPIQLQLPRTRPARVVSRPQSTKLGAVENTPTAAAHGGSSKTPGGRVLQTKSDNVHGTEGFASGEIRVGVKPTSHFFQLASRRPVISRNNRCTTIKHTEMCSKWQSAAGVTPTAGQFWVNSGRLSPTNSGFFPWLSEFSLGKFAQFRFKNVHFHFVTTQPTSAAGLAYMFFDPDANDELMLNQSVGSFADDIDMRTIFSFRHTKVTSVYENATLSLTAKDTSGSVGGGLYYLADDLADGVYSNATWMPDSGQATEAHSTACGFVGYGCDGYTGYEAGFLCVSYEVELFNPELEEREIELSRMMVCTSMLSAGASAANFNMSSVFGMQPEVCLRQLWGDLQIATVWDYHTLLLEHQGRFKMTLSLTNATFPVLNAAGAVLPVITPSPGVTLKYVGVLMHFPLNDLVYPPTKELRDEYTVALEVDMYVTSVGWLQISNVAGLFSGASSTSPLTRVVLTIQPYLNGPAYMIGQ
jgi:hypothetical protein